jgi:hypothetical protein
VLPLVLAASLVLAGCNEDEPEAVAAPETCESQASASPPAEPLGQGPGNDVVQAIPWAAPEVSEYELREAGFLEGTGIISIEAAGELVSLSQVFCDSAGNSDSRVVLADADDLNPWAMERIVVGAEEDTRIEVRASYTTDAAAFESIAGQSENRQTRDRQANSFDSEQHLFIGRTIPFDDGYETEYRAMDAATTETRTVDLEVTKRETIEVPAGEFDTWKVEFRYGSSTTTAWYTVDPPHYLVKANVLDFDYLLKALPD